MSTQLQMAELNTANKIVKTPILQLVAGSVPERVLVVGDPKRAKYVSGYLTDTERIWLLPFRYIFHQIN